MDNDSNQSDKGSVKYYYFNPDRSIVLGDYLDILLNRTGSAEKRNLPAFENINYSKDLADRLISCNDEKVPEGRLQYDGGILLPRSKGSDQSGQDTGDEGSGNIVIMGAAGTGKSTLAFQIAAACASDMNHGIAVYYSLEVSIPQFIYSMVSEKAQESNHRLQIKELRDLYDNTNLDSDVSLCLTLEKVLLENCDKNGAKNAGNIQPQILLPSLSPCSISDDQASHNEVFLKRFKELEFLLRAISCYNKKIEETKIPATQGDANATKDAKQSDQEQRSGDIPEQPAKETSTAPKNPKVKVVVIDSINAFSNSTLNRQEIIRLMSLFKEYGIIGIFTLGDDGDQSSEAMIEASTIQYLADVVISLTCAYTNSYTHNYLEITKSRYRQQVLGKHPYKIGAVNKDLINLASLFNGGIKKKIEVLPSLHYRTNASEQVKSNQAIKSEKDEWNLFGINAMTKILPEHFAKRSKDLTQIITIIGGSGLYKSDIAINALLNGIYEGKSGLIVRFSDRELFRHSGVRLSEELYTKVLSKIDTSTILMTEIGSDTDASKLKPYKLNLVGWEPSFSTDHACLYEVAFKSGVLYPEEMVDELIRIITFYKIKRIVLADLKLIGVSYPFLVDSPTSGKIFLSAFLHIMRNYGVHVIITSSLSAQADSVDQINRARILSDAVLDIKQDKKSANVTIFGEGLITKNKNEFCIQTGPAKTRFEFVNERAPKSTESGADKNASNPAEQSTDNPVPNSTPKLVKKKITFSPALKIFIVKPKPQRTNGSAS